MCYIIITVLVTTDKDGAKIDIIFEMSKFLDKNNL